MAAVPCGSNAVVQSLYERVHSDPASSHCTELARHWLTTCTDSHQCTTDQTFVSDSVTRFLHISPNASTISLVEFPPNEAPSGWAALSYRWGDVQRLMLTRSNISKLKQGIHLKELDATMYDAVFICRALHLEYLWVDALCVFQDSTKDDWLAQSSKMQEVYEKSTLTIVTIDTSSVHDKILVPRYDQYISIPWDLYGLSEDCGSLNDVYLSKQWDPNRDRLAGPWSSRGWTLQEGFLPRRLLYYTATQMVWKCCKETRYERGAVTIPAQKVADEYEDEGDGTFWAFDLFTKMKLISGYMDDYMHINHRQKYRLWYELMEEYSSRHLTNSSDRSIAISGLAAKYNQLLDDDRYVAGLWEADMVRGLMWHVIGTKSFSTSEFGTRPGNTYQYPTWSWLGVASGYTVRNDHGSNIDCRDLAQVKCIDVYYENPLHPFGDTLKAVLTLRGHILFFNRLYAAEWRFSTSLSAFERHISQLVEEEYGKGASELAQESRFAAVLMLQHFPSINHRRDVLVLEAVDQRGNAPSNFRRRGIVQLCYYSDQTKVSQELRRLRRRDSLSHRLGLFRGPRRVKYLPAKAVFDEIDAGLWTWQELTVV